MKPQHKPIRIARVPETLIKSHGPYWGVDNWFVGRVDNPLQPWLQFELGWWNVQVKWYLVALVFLVLSFMLGRWAV